MAKLREITAFLDNFLQLSKFNDSSQNGLQVEAPEEIQKIAFAVDARMATFERAISAGAQLLICHHGLFWGRGLLVTGRHYQRLRYLLSQGLGLYAAHLPLDAHPEVGNNAALARVLQLENLLSWAEYKGQKIGVAGDLPSAMTIEDFSSMVGDILRPFGGEIRLYGKGQASVRRIGIVTGDAALEIDQALAEKFDVLLTGETNHIVAAISDEIEGWLLCGGHYATETFGVRALAETLHKAFGVETVFLHVPTFL